MNNAFALNGFLAIYKPRGVTSFDVVRPLKRMYKPSKIGHVGTLDPEAEGLLVICVGEATKLVSYFMDLKKEYIATARLGVSTNTDDADPKATVLSVCDEKKVLALSLLDVEECLAKFIGEYMQTPPIYSALKSQGIPLYQLAREKEIDLSSEILQEKQRKVCIEKIELINLDLPMVTFRVVCEKGTYIRSIARDLGNMLGVGGHLSFLLRTKIGSFSLEDALILDTYKKANITGGFQLQIPNNMPPFPLIPIEQAILNFPKLTITLEEKERVKNGILPISVLDRIEKELLGKIPPFALMDERGLLVAMLRKEQDRIQIGRVFTHER